MKYYAHYGHKDFILCLGYKADKIKDYFLNYQEYVSNDFTMSNGGKAIELESSDIHDWKITFVDTGIRSNIGERLKAVEKHLKGEEVFLANYSDGLTDMPLPTMIDNFMKSEKVAGFMSAPPSQTFHIVTIVEGNHVAKIQNVRDSGIRVNAGFFAFRKEIFDYIGRGEELVLEPFQHLIEKSLLMTYQYDHFWTMDTFKEQQELNDMFNQGNAPWEVWKKGIAK